MQKGLERKSILPIKDVFKILKKDMKCNNTYSIVDGEKIHTNSDRYKLFMTFGCTCCRCGLKAEYFALEKFKDQQQYHLNLYGTKNGKEILFTKDHIVPKSKGGKNKLENYQTMCEICNERKADN